MQRFVVVGLGHFGSWVARALRAQGHEVIAIDPDAEVVDRHAGLVTRAVVGDATDVELLKEVGAGTADAAVISTGENLAVSVLSAQALHDLGVKDIYVKVGSAEAARVFESLRVTETVFPEREVALRLAHRVTSKAVFEYLPLGKGVSIQEIAIPDAWLGKSLRELALPRRHGITVVALYDVLAGQLDPAPDPDAPLKESDLAVVVGRDDVISALISSAP